MPEILNQIQDFINKASECGDPKICYLGPKAYKEFFHAISDTIDGSELKDMIEHLYVKQEPPIFAGVKVVLNKFYRDDVITIADRTFEENNYKVMIAGHIKGLSA